MELALCEFSFTGGNQSEVKCLLFKEVFRDIVHRVGIELGHF